MQNPPPPRLGGRRECDFIQAPRTGTRQTAHLTLMRAWSFFGRSLLPAVLILVGTGLLSPASVQTSRHLGEAEAAYQEVRYYKDQIDTTLSRQAARSIHDVSLGDLLERYRTARGTLQSLLASVAPDSLDSADRRAFEVMKATLREELVENPAVAGGEAGSNRPECDSDPVRLAEEGGGLPVLTERVYACFGDAAHNVQYDGQVLDRLTVLGMLSREGDPESRQRLFLSLEGIWRSVNRDGDASSPYRQMVRLRAESWRGKLSPMSAKSLQFGIDPEVMEGWLVSILEEWKKINSDAVLEPWDFYYANGKASRLLSPRIPLNRLEETVDRYYRKLGADPRKLGIHYDLEPRSGKDPVAFTTFGARNRSENRRWVQGEFWVFAAYRTGGLDNLAELMHETGHGIHLAGIRTRPAYEDWPDSDPFTEGLADFTGLEVFEPEWQKRYLGISASPADSIRNKYAAVVMDVAWALFEIRMHRNPDLDPNRLWTELTKEYLGIVPHPELSWWAMRGQLVDAPGYMVNYAIGSIIAADLRARLRRLKGGKSLTRGDPTWYPWLSERIYRYGLELPSKQVLEEFLGRPISPRALLEDMGRATLPGRSARKAVPEGGSAVLK